MKNSLIKKLGIGVLTASALLGINSQNANAQKRKFPENNDHGAKFYQYKEDSNWSLEEKVFYNNETGKQERFYMNHIDADKYQGDLDFAALDFNKTIPKMNLQTKEISELTSKEGMYVYFPEKLANGQLANSIKVTNSHIAGWCENQIRAKAGVQKGVNYISIDDIKNLFPEQGRLRLGNEEDFIVLTVPKDLQKKGKTNHYLIPVDNKHEVGFDPETKKIILYGSIYRGVLENAPATFKAESSIGSDLGRDESYKEPAQNEKKSKAKKSNAKKGAAYLIFGANTNFGENINDKFWEGNLGIQYGPVALVGSYGQAKDERIKEITTPASQITGRYGFGTEDNVNTKVFGLGAELHLFSNKKVSPFIGGGINNWNYTTEVREQLLDANKNIIKSNFNSKAKSELSYKGIAGLNFKAGEKSKLGIQAGYDTKAKGFAGFRYSLKLGK